MLLSSTSIPYFLTISCLACVFHRADAGNSGWNGSNNPIPLLNPPHSRPVYLLSLIDTRIPTQLSRSGSLIFQSSVGVVVGDRQGIPPIIPGYEARQVFDLAELTLVTVEEKGRNYIPIRGIDTKIVGRQLDCSGQLGQFEFFETPATHFHRHTEFVGTTQATNLDLQVMFKNTLSLEKFSLGLLDGESRGGYAVIKDFIVRELNLQMTSNVATIFELGQDWDDRFAPRLNGQFNHGPQTTRIENLIVMKAADNTLHDITIPTVDNPVPAAIERSTLDWYWQEYLDAQGGDMMENPYEPAVRLGDTIDESASMEFMSVDSEESVSYLDPHS